MSSSSSSPAAQKSVQKVPKASSDELLRKFSALEDEPAPSSTNVVLRPSIRRKRSRRVASIFGARDFLSDGGSSGGGCDVRVSAAGRVVMKNRRSGDSGSGVVECKALLPGSPRRTSASAMRLGPKDVGFAGIGLLLAALDKSWRKTIKGASKIFIEKNRSSQHIRLIGDVG